MKKLTLVVLGIAFAVSAHGQRPDKEHLIIPVSGTIVKLEVTDRTSAPVTTSFFEEEQDTVLISREWGNMRSIQDLEAGFLFSAIEVRAEVENIRKALSDSLGIGISQFFADVLERNNRQLDGNWDYQVINPNGTVDQQTSITIDSIFFITDPGGNTVGEFQWYSSNKIEADIPNVGATFFFVTQNRRKWLGEDPTNDRKTHVLRKTN